MVNCRGADCILPIEFKTMNELESETWGAATGQHLKVHELVKRHCHLVVLIFLLLATQCWPLGSLASSAESLSLAAQNQSSSSKDSPHRQQASQSTAAQQLSSAALPTGTSASKQESSSALGSSSVNEDELILASDIDSDSSSSSNNNNNNNKEQLKRQGSSGGGGGAPAADQAQQLARDLIGQALGGASESLPTILNSSSSAASNVTAQLPLVVSPKFSSSVGELTAKLPDSLTATYKQFAAATAAAAANSSSSNNNNSNNSTANSSIESLLPRATSLFSRDSIDASQLAQMDCHLRNIDYCLAGLIGSSQKLLPETNDELEVRCDEMKATSSCMAIYNKRCQTLKIFSMLVPFAQASGETGTGSGRVGGSSGSSDDNQTTTSDAIDRIAEQQRIAVSSLSQEVKLGPQIESALMNKQQPVQLDGTGAAQAARAVSLANLMELCEPSERKSRANVQLRQRIFSLASCINARIPKLNPCLDDLKTALQIFYEPRRSLPMQPTCCAMARFRTCSSAALDKVCGLSSFEQLIKSFGGGGGAGIKMAPSSGPLGMLTTMDRMCKQASDYKSAYCAEVLPPSGMRMAQRRGNKASKLAKALDLFSFSPASQDLSLL